jgi:outer membrane protein OmpA-like peptidoglycan-associated protein
MKKTCIIVFGVMLAVVLMGGLAFGQQDAKGCKDHPLFTRLSNTYISECKFNEFEAREWPDPDTQGKTKVRVEGRYYSLMHYNQKEFQGKRSDLQVSRNYSNAMKKIGGSVYEADERNTYMKLLKDGREIWAYVSSYRGDQIRVEIIEKEAMKQEIVADAKFLAERSSSSSMGSAEERKDAKGCKDHPLFTRLPYTYIYECKDVDFEAREWPDPETLGKTKAKVEGKYYYIFYYPQKEYEGKRSDLQVSRNYSNAMKKIEAKVYEADERNTYMRLLKDGREIWAYVSSYRGDQIRVEIIEKEAMKQEIVAGAKIMAEGISRAGHVAIYGIYFDFNKSDIKPESESALSEIAKLFTANPSLKVFIVGHTDNVGGLDYNMKLSQARADAVVKALTSKYKVNPQNLKAYGVGQLGPVAPNKTEEGRAKNRRVEIVEQ